MPDTTIRVPDGSVIITPSQMYTELVAVREAVQKLTATVDPALTDVRNDVNDHENRIRSLEHRMWKAAGAVAVIAAGGAAGLTKVFGG